MLKKPNQRNTKSYPLSLPTTEVFFPQGHVARSRPHVTRKKRNNKGKKKKKKKKRGALNVGFNNKPKRAGEA